MKNSKMTKKEMFTMLLDVEGVKGNEMFTDFINKQIDSLNRKSSAHKETATQKANKELKSLILDLMEVGTAYTVTNLIKTFDELADYSNQKISALMKQLVDEGLVVRGTEKRSSVFSKVA